MATAQETILAVDNLRVTYHTDAGPVRAVDRVSFFLRRGERFGLVGESGSGKSTVGKCIARLVHPTGGRVILDQVDITHLSASAMRPIRRNVHMIFQDPYSSLNPRLRIREIVAGPLVHHRIVKRGAALRARVAEGLERVGLRPEIGDRFPHQLSGGQRQRVAIARALILRPSLLIADEPLSALDASIQASTINLLLDLQAELRFAVLFITHDLSTAEYLCDRIAVMYLGKIVEVAPRAELFLHPKHPYTQALLSAVLVADPAVQRTRRKVVLGGDIPSAVSVPSGCPFQTRCPVAVERCRTEVPQLVDVTGANHLASCHLVGPDGHAPEILANPAAGAEALAG
jgi:oligopeptide/dipeptide ABC transporter ATP-binding protein